MTEKLLAVLMLTGVRVSGLFLIAGLAWWLVDRGNARAEWLLAAGLMALMATPMLRVAVSVVEAIRARDWFYVMVTLAVVVILAITLTSAAR
jgi:uncharacterized membrane protein